jgi:hypothetical protein
VKIVCRSDNLLAWILKTDKSRPDPYPANHVPISSFVSPKLSLPKFWKNRGSKLIKYCVPELPKHDPKTFEYFRRKALINQPNKVVKRQNNMIIIL